LVFIRFGLAANASARQPVAQGVASGDIATATRFHATVSTMGCTICHDKSENNLNDGRDRDAATGIAMLAIFLAGMGSMRDMQAHLMAAHLPTSLQFVVMD
jgi:hypothetical protein